MNEDWKTYKIGSLGTVITGKTPSTQEEGNFNGKYPFITIPDLDGRVFIEKTERSLSDQGASRVKGSLLPKNAVMMSCIATIGKCGITTRPSFTNQQINSVICSENVDPRFLYYIFTQLGHELEAIGGGGSVYTNVSKSRFSDIEVKLPPLPEQRAIADVLSSLDDKIELNRQMNRTLEQLARALFKHWFIDNPERDKWEEGTLGDLASNIRRGVQTSDLVDHNVYIGLEHMPQKSIALGNWGNAETISSNKFAFKRGEILFGKLRPYFHKVGVAPTDGVCSTDILVINPKIAHYFGFVLSVVSSTEFVNAVNLASEGTKMPRTNWNYMAKYPISIPSRQTAKEFNSFVQPIVEQIISNIHQSRTLAELRDTLLPKLMSGQVKIN